MTQLDYSILFWIQEHLVADFLTPVMKLLTTLGNGGLIWIVLSIVLLIFKETRWLGIAALLSLALTAFINNEIIKAVIQRPRPFVGFPLDLLIKTPGGWSFPSGHTSTSFAAATAIFIKNKAIGTPALLCAFLIGLSRLYFFVHFPSDVLIGAVEGIIIAVAVSFAVDYFRKKSSSTSERP